MAYRFNKRMSYTDEEIKEWMAMRASGMSYKQIEAVTDVSHGTIHKYCLIEENKSKVNYDELNIKIVLQYKMQEGVSNELNTN